MSRDKPLPRLGACRRIDIPVRDYLAAVLPGLANTPIQRLAQLTPTTWSSHSL